jgi:hypothetical protein
MSSVIQANLLIALTIVLAATVAAMGIGAFLLRNAVKDTSDLASALPTRLLKEDTSESRESNRCKALCDMLWLLTFRSAPGVVLVVSGAGVLIWICLKLLPKLQM